MGKTRISKTQANVDYINNAADEGREFIFKSELPYPQMANRSISKSKALAENGSVVYLREQLKK